MSYNTICGFILNTGFWLLNSIYLGDMYLYSQLTK